MLASYYFVNAVVIFDEYTPSELIKDIDPNVVVKGRGYSQDNVIAEGCEVLVLDQVDAGLSTTSLVEKLR